MYGPKKSNFFPFRFCARHDRFIYHKQHRLNWDFFHLTTKRNIKCMQFLLHFAFRVEQHSHKHFRVSIGNCSRITKFFSLRAINLEKPMKYPFLFVSELSFVIEFSANFKLRVSFKRVYCFDSDHLFVYLSPQTKVACPILPQSMFFC